MATDNYIEKYLPFKIQNIVSECVFSTMDIHSKEFEAYKQFEYKAYKKIHKIVLADEGIPNLKKRAYQMPGYRKILDKDEKNYYEKALSKQ